MTHAITAQSLCARLRAELLATIPRVLCLLDKNPLSKTHGCLDRKYWQYKIIDFPSGMQQELARVLAWAWADQGEDNPWRGSPRLREHALAAVAFYARAMHPDGSLDDYFPWERALGATAYATAAVADACRLLGWTPDETVRDALRRAARFMTGHLEAGMLANHHAIAATALFAVADLTGDASFDTQAREKIAGLRALQHPDGWFPEYEGCDLGYQTVTLEFLARCEALRPGSVPGEMFGRLTAFLRDFAHPDGSLGGEYCSRNTYNFYPGGFALRSGGSDAAAEMLWLHMRGLENGAANHLEDDGCFGHMLSSAVTVLTAREVQVLEPSFQDSPAPWIRAYEGSGLYRAGTGGLRLYGNLTKGGCFKLFRGEELLCSDTGFSGSLLGGALFCQNNPGSSAGRIEGNELRIEGAMRRYRTKRLTAFSMLALRLLCFCFGRFSWFSGAIRRLMQAMLIYNKNTVPVSFSRRILLDQQGVTVSDAASCEPPASFEALYLTTDCVNMHVVTSDSYQRANLEPWTACPAQGRTDFELARRFEAASPTD
ncbi:MAG: hypothetical protein ACLGQW_12330 [Acidobacteriota bacterium]